MQNQFHHDLKHIQTFIFFANFILIFANFHSATAKDYYVFITYLFQVKERVRLLSAATTQETRVQPQRKHREEQHLSKVEDYKTINVCISCSVGIVWQPARTYLIASLCEIVQGERRQNHS